MDYSSIHNKGGGRVPLRCTVGTAASELVPYLKMDFRIGSRYSRRYTSELVPELLPRVFISELVPDYFKSIFSVFCFKIGRL